jgi:exosome complex exonuclease RRP6
MVGEKGLSKALPWVDRADGICDEEFDQFVATITNSLRETTARANDLPAGADFTLYSALSGSKQRTDRFGNEVLGHLRKLLEVAGGKPRIFDGTDDDDKFDTTVDVADSLLESVGKHIDQVAGILKAPAVAVKSRSIPQHPLAQTWQQTKEMRKPQLDFSDKPDNSNSAFIPRYWMMRSAQLGALEDGTPISPTSPADAIPPALAEHLEAMGVRRLRSGALNFPHPHEKLIRSLEFTPQQLQPPQTAQLYLPLSDTPLTWVDTAEKLESLISLLSKETELAIDLENHSHRSFHGFLCLMQISTRRADFLIDLIELRSQMHNFATILENPKILKVFHGADSDVRWLERDFGLYVINMFDTGQASRVLELPSFGLAHLLSHFCDVQADKKYQLADWRTRPLPSEMIRYAREDTHYLLYVYDRLRQQLVEKAGGNDQLLLATLRRSQDICLLRWEKEIWSESAYLELYNRHNKLLDNTQLRVFKALFDWRDKLARELDESKKYVMSSALLFVLAECCSSI